MQYFLNTKPAEEEMFFNFLEQLQSKKEPFIFKTSGSTGSPKAFSFTYNQLIISAQQTIATFGLKKGKPLLLPLSMNYIAAKMMVVRAHVLQAPLYLISPDSQAIMNIPTLDFQLASFVPLQVESAVKQEIIPTNLNRIETLLIGGAPLTLAVESKIVQQHKGKAYHTYGMTETLSHVAVRALATDYYQALQGVSLKVNTQNCLMIKSPIDSNWLTTNDLVELNGNTFKWLGRSDNVINSGGVKIIPEQVESIIEKTLGLSSVVFGRSHPSLGSQCEVCLEQNQALAEEQKQSLQLKLPAFHFPKKWHYLEKFPLLNNGKINRQQVIDQFINGENS